jgi:hypothetical protein
LFLTAQESRGLLGVNGIDVGTEANFKTGEGVEAGYDLKMPRVIVTGAGKALGAGALQRRGMEEEIITGTFKDEVEALEGETKDFGEVVKFVRSTGGVVGMMALGKDGEFEGKAAGKRTKEKVAVVVGDKPGAIDPFGVEDVAEEAALLDEVMFVGANEFALDKGWNEGKGDELRVGVGEGSAGAGADVLEDVDVLETLVLVEVEDAFPITGEDFSHGSDGQVFQRELAVGGLDDDFVGADAADTVVKPFGTRLERTFNPHGGVAVRNDADTPTGFIRLGLFLAESVDLGRREAFVAFGEGIQHAGLEDRGGKILGTPLAFRGKNDPDVMERIATKFGMRHAGAVNQAGLIMQSQAARG